MADRIGDLADEAEKARRALRARVASIEKLARLAIVAALLAMAIATLALTSCSAPPVAEREPTDAAVRTLDAMREWAEATRRYYANRPTDNRSTGGLHR